MSKLPKIPGFELSFEIVEGGLTILRYMFSDKSYRHPDRYKGKKITNAKMKAKKLRQIEKGQLRVQNGLRLKKRIIVP